MSDKKITILINMAVPATLKFDGKTGSVVRLVEILKRMKEANGEIKLVLTVTSWIKKHFEENHLEGNWRIIHSSLRFGSYWGLIIKTFYLTIKSLCHAGIFSEEDKRRQLVVYSSSDLFWEVVPAFFYKMKKKETKWVQIIHHIYLDWKKRQGGRLINFLGCYFQKFSLFLIRNKADKIIVLNNLVKKELLRLGFVSEKIVVSGNGINLEFIKNILPAEVSYDGVYLGRLGQSKGVDDLLEIWVKVSEKIYGAKLAVIGGGGEKEKKELARKTKERGLEGKIAFLGFIEDKKAISIMKSSKVFLFPSHEEGWGMAVAEALASGLPVVAWNLPVYSEIFEKNVIEIEENNIDLFSRKVAELLENNSFREKSGLNGKKFVQKYSWEEVARKEWEIIKSL